jgi:hypothetical protein
VCKEVNKAHKEGENAQEPSEKIMTSYTFSLKFPYNTQFTIGSLIFATGEDRNLQLLTQSPALKRLESVYGQAPYLPASSSTSSGAYSGLNPYTGSYHHAAKTTQGNSIRAPIFQPPVGILSSSSSAVSSDQYSTDNYPGIGGSAC